MFWFCKKSDILNFSKIITGRFSAFKYFAVNAYFRRKNFFEENIQNIKLLQKISTWENFCRKKRRYRKNNCNLKPKVENFEKYIFIRRPVAYVKTIHFSFSLQIFIFFFWKFDPKASRNFRYHTRQVKSKCEIFCEGLLTFIDKIFSKTELTDKIEKFSKM